MATSSDSDQANMENNLREIVLDGIQKVLNDKIESAESNEPTVLATTTNDTAFEELLLPGNIDVSNNPTVGNTCPSPILRQTIDRYIDTFGLAQDSLRSTGDASTGSDATTTNEHQNENPVVQQTTITAIDNPPTSLTIERHIMISYNRDSAADICETIYQRLQDRGYKVWIDQNHLHGKVLKAMAQGVENSYIVLICYNEKYSESDFCEIETTYAFGKHIDLIPCRLQASYDPSGWLGSVVSTRNYIDFAPPIDFDSAFEKLIREIDYIKIHPQTNRPIQHNNDDNQNFHGRREQFDAIVREFQQSINKNDEDLNSLTKEELTQLVHYVRERLFKETRTTSERSRNDDSLIRSLFEQSRTQTELLQRMTEILSQPIDFKTMIKLALVFLFVWTVKTHIIDVYIKQK